MRRWRRSARVWPGSNFLRADWLAIVLPLLAIAGLGVLMAYEFWVALDLWMAIDAVPRR